MSTESSSLSPAHRDELIRTIAGRLRSWNLETPAILCLYMLEPLAFLGSQLILFTQPFVSPFAGDRLLRDLALLVEKPENIEQLIAQLGERS